MNETCVCVSLRKASRKLTALYDEALRPAGINVAQFSLLRNIDRHGPLSLTALGEIVELDRSTLGRNVRVLERMGLASLASGNDQRETMLSLTALGRATLQKSILHWDDAQAMIHRRIGDTGVAQLEALLSAL